MSCITNYWIMYGCAPTIFQTLSCEFSFHQVFESIKPINSVDDDDDDVIPEDVFMKMIPGFVSPPPLAVVTFVLLHIFFSLIP